MYQVVAQVPDGKRVLGIRQEPYGCVKTLRAAKGLAQSATEKWPTAFVLIDEIVSPDELVTRALVHKGQWFLARLGPDSIA